MDSGLVKLFARLESFLLKTHKNRSEMADILRYFEFLITPPL